MKNKKREKLEKAGWKVGSVSDFLDDDWLPGQELSKKEKKARKPTVLDKLKRKK